EIVSHRKKRRARHCHTATSYKRKPQHHPTIYDVRCDECRKTKGRESSHDLRVHHQPASINQVGKDAACECEDKTGRRSHEGVKSEPERRVSQLEYEPT